MQKVAYGEFPQFQNVTHPGQNNGTGDTRALYMKLFAGEVLTMFRSECLSLPTTRVMTLSKGSSYKFPMHGFSHSATYHKAGELIQAGGVNHVERTVTVDDVAAAVVFVDTYGMDGASVGMNDFGQPLYDIGGVTMTAEQAKDTMCSFRW